MEPFELIKRLNAKVHPLKMPVLHPRNAHRQKRLAVPRAPVEAIEGLFISLLPSLDRLNWSEFGAPVEIAFTVGGEVGYLRTVMPLLQRLLARAQVHLRPEELDAEMAAMVVETVLADRIEDIEAKLGAEVNLLHVAKSEPRSSMAALGFEVGSDLDGVKFPGAIFGSAALLSNLAKLWELQSASRPDWNSLTFTLASRVAYTDITQSAVRELRVGDAMLFDRIAVPGGTAVIVAEALHATANFDEHGLLYLAQTLGATEQFALGEFIMSDEDDAERAIPAIQDVSVDDLPVRLVFEIGRADITLDELRSLSVGAPLPLERAANSAVHIFANGRRIGAGEMVMIGDQLGVRVTRLNGNA